MQPKDSMKIKNMLLIAAAITGLTFNTQAMQSDNDGIPLDEQPIAQEMQGCDDDLNKLFVQFAM